MFPVDHTLIHPHSLQLYWWREHLLPLCLINTPWRQLLHLKHWISPAVFLLNVSVLTADIVCWYISGVPCMCYTVLYNFCITERTRCMRESATLKTQVISQTVYHRSDVDSSVRGTLPVLLKLIVFNKKILGKVSATLILSLAKYCEVWSLKANMLYCGRESLTCEKKGCSSCGLLTAAKEATTDFNSGEHQNLSAWQSSYYHVWSLKAECGLWRAREASVRLARWVLLRLRDAQLPKHQARVSSLGQTGASRQMSYFFMHEAH